MSEKNSNIKMMCSLSSASLTLSVFASLFMSDKSESEMNYLLSLINANGNSVYKLQLGKDNCVAH